MRALFAITVLAFVPGLPYLEMGTMWLLDGFLAAAAPGVPGNVTPVGLRPGWDLPDYLFLVGAARLVGGAAAASALTVMGWRGGGRLRVWLVAMLVACVVAVAESVLVLADHGCFFMTEAPWSCSPGD